MARIDTRERLLQLKLVYYGPALGGKTTNLQSLHRMLDPKGAVELMSLDTDGDRTLFFDLLPIELAEIRGFRLKLRLFTVPGQVHYNATRRLVLRDVDGVVFVADSSPSRLDANRESLRTLDGNLVANAVPPGTVPIVLQANKRDLPDAAGLDEIDRSLDVAGLDAHGRAVLPELLPASAAMGRGVLETFEALLRAAVAAAYRRYGLQRLGLRREDLGRALDEALAPCRQRLTAPEPTQARPSAAAEPTASGAPPAAASPPARPAETASAARSPWAVVDPEEAERVLETDDLLAESVRQSLDLAEALGDQQALRRDLEQRVRELESVNQLACRLARTVDEGQILEALAEAASCTLASGAGSAILWDGDGAVRALALSGLDSEPLLHAGEPPLAEMIAAAREPVHYADLDTELVYGDPSLLARLAPFCSLAAVPFALPDPGKGLMVAYGADAECPAGPEASRFLRGVAAQATLAMQNVHRHGALLRHQSRLEEEVAERTAELRIAHQELVAASRLKDRILSCVNHELRTPLTKLLAVAQVLERAKPGSEPPPGLLSGLAGHARGLARLLDQVLTAQSLLSPEPGEGSATATEEARVDLEKTLEAVVFTHLDRAAARGVVVRVEKPEGALPVRGDAGSVTLALSQLLDNAVKFTGQGTEVRVEVMESDSTAIVRVMDEGPGVAPADAERIFNEFDQGSADHLVSKPSGLGLGLAIARRLARRVGGDLALEPARPGAGGATFVLTLVRPVRQPLAGVR